MPDDRHKTDHFSLRPSPSDLLKRLDEAVGAKDRSRAISLLLSRLLDRRPIRSPEELKAELDKLPRRYVRPPRPQ